MNADEARKCVAVARRLLAQTDAWTDRDAAQTTLDRALKYAEKGARLDPDAVGSEAEGLINAIAARRLDVDAGRGRASASGAGGAAGASGANGQKHGMNGSRDEGARRRTSAGASPSDKPAEHVKGTPEQEALMARVRRANDDYYKIIGIERGATDDEIKKAYRKTALKLHPDKCQATGADEVFKQVSRAFACLSDADKKAAYDRYGTEDPNSRQSPFGGGVHRGARRGGYYQEDVDPAEIFNMFFGGGGFPGGPGVRFATHRGGAYYRANRLYQESRRQSGGAGFHPGRGQERAQNTDDLLRNLFQLLPVMIVFLMYFLAPGEEQNFALNRTPTFSHQLKTQRHEFPFYVRSAREWEETYPAATVQRRRMEHNIEMTHINHLESNCLYERQQQQRMYRFGTRAERERAREMTMHSCERLHDIRVKQSSERLAAGNARRGV